MFDSEVKMFEEYIKQLENYGKGKAPVDFESSKKSPLRDEFSFGNYLTIKDGKLSLLIDYFVENGKKFTSFMEHCCQLYPEDEHANLNQYPFPSDFHEFIVKTRRCKSGFGSSGGTITASLGGCADSDSEGDDNEDSLDDDCSQSDEDVDSQGDDATDDEENDEESSSSTQHIIGKITLSTQKVLESNQSRMQETRHFFHVYIARLFFHNVKVAYREVVARANQMTLLADLQKEDKLREAKERKKQEKLKKKAKTK